MKIVDNIKPSKKYMICNDVPVGSCFRYVGEEKVFFQVEDCGYSLDNGQDNYNYDEDMPVEIVEGYFTVTGIKNN